MFLISFTLLKDCRFAVKNKKKTSNSINKNVKHLNLYILLQLLSFFFLNKYNNNNAKSAN